MSTNRISKRISLRGSLRLTPEGRSAIDTVRVRYQLSGNDIGVALGISPRVVSNILTARRALTREHSMALYEILHKVPEVEFLNQYGQNTGVGVSQFLTDFYYQL